MNIAELGVTFGVGTEDIIHEDGTVSPALQSEVEKIYLGYRQCYTKDPTAEPEYDYEKLHEEAVKYYASVLRETGPKYISCEYEQQTNKEAAEKVEELYKLFGKEAFLQYFYKCKFIAKHKNHESQLEHGVLTVRVTGCSRAMTHQWTRSRIASHGQQSQRYCDESGASFVVPPSIAKNEKAMKVYEETIDLIMNATNVLRDAGIPREDVRFLLPNATASQIVTTANFREWLHIFSERCCTKAQWEIRDVCNTIWTLLRIAVPFIFDPQYGGGPKCNYFGWCPEEKSCGKAMSREDVRKIVYAAQCFQVDADEIVDMITPK